MLLLSKGVIFGLQPSFQRCSNKPKSKHTNKQPTNPTQTKTILTKPSKNNKNLAMSTTNSMVHSPEN